jgi:hypothetical protein
MKIWRWPIFLGLVVFGGTLAAQEASATSQLNRLRVLQNQIWQDAVALPTALARGEWWLLSLSSGIAYTTNANLDSNGSVGDFYSTNSLGIRWLPDLGPGFGFSTGLMSTDFRYLRHPELSMSFLDWDAGITWRGTVFGIASQGYLSQTLEWTQQEAFADQTFSNILALGGSVAREIRPGHTISAAAELSATPYAWPSQNAYTCVSLTASYDLALAPGVTLDVSVLGYETMYFVGERDLTVSCSATVSWAITSWLSASAFASPTWNSSNTAGASYTVVDTGVNVSGIFRF